MAKKQLYEDFKKRYDSDRKVLEGVLDFRCENDLCVNPKCGQRRKLGYRYMSKRKAFICRFCLFHVYPLSGSIFNRTHFSPVHLFQIIYQMLFSRNAISAKEVQRQYGYSYNSTFYLMHDIRKLMGDACEKFSFDDSVVVEVDEAGIRTGKNGLSKLYRYDIGRKNERNSSVLAMVERTGRAKLFYVPNTERVTIFKKIFDEIPKDALIVTDEYPVYKTLTNEGYQHVTVNHSATKNRYKDVSGCTNSCEGIFSILSRSVKGTYASISRFRLSNYLNELSFKYSYRNNEDYGFNVLLVHLGSLNKHYSKEFQHYPTLKQKSQ